jgi:hypothetical protein
MNQQPWHFVVGKNDVLPIGGVKDKLLAAHRVGLVLFLLPRRNERDLREVDREILERIEVVPVDTVDQVLERALLPADGRRAGDRRVGFLVTDDGAPTTPAVAVPEQQPAVPSPAAGGD